MHRFGVSGSAGRHELTTTYEAKGLARQTDLGHRAHCSCGWKQAMAGTKKMARRDFYAHRASVRDSFQCESCGEFFAPTTEPITPTEGRLLYFAYGMNLAPSAMGYFGCTHPVAPATLRGWKLTLRGYMDIQPSEGDEVVGGLWEIDAHALHQLDGREGYRPEGGGFYDRREVDVDVAGEKVRALVYFMRKPYEESPNPSYVELVREGYEFFGLPQNKLDAVDASARKAFAARRCSHGIPGDEYCPYCFEDDEEDW